MPSVRLQGQLCQCRVAELREEAQWEQRVKSKGNRGLERVYGGGRLGNLCMLKDGLVGLTPMDLMTVDSLCSRGTLKWPDGRNHAGDFCQGLEHG